jgi:hypothetical protein
LPYLSLIPRKSLINSKQYSKDQEKLLLLKEGIQEPRSLKVKQQVTRKDLTRLQRAWKRKKTTTMMM